MWTVIWTRPAERDLRRLAQRLEKVSRMLGLSTLMDRYPRQLSGGQRQRVAMGRAIMREPQVFLFDEPLSNIDANLRVRMRSQVKLLQQSLNEEIRMAKWIEDNLDATTRKYVQLTAAGEKAGV